MKRRWTIAMALLAGASAVVGTKWFISSSPVRESTEAPLGLSKENLGEDANRAVASKKHAVPRRTERLREVQKEYEWTGSQNVEVTLSERGGRLLALKVVGGRPLTAPGELETDHESEKVRKRARWVLERLAPKIGVGDPQSLRETKVNQSPLSAVVHFEQTHQALPLLDRGSIRVVFSQDGRLVSVHSDFVAEVRPQGEFVLSESQAQTQLGNSLKKDPSTLRPGRVGWVVVDRARINPVYEWWSEGKQVMVSATDGRVLWMKDQRIH